MKKISRLLIDSSLIYYLVGIIFLWSTCDITRVRSNRLNYLKDAASYPVEYMEGKVPLDKRQLYYARQYYENLLGLIPIYEQKGMLNGNVITARAWAMIGICQFYLGNYSPAVYYMKKAAEKEPRQFWFQYDLALMYLSTDHNAEALAQIMDLLPFSKEKLEAGMQLDYYELWPSAMAAEYKIVSLQKYYYFLIKSYTLAILAAERLKDTGSVRTLALAAIKSGVAEEDRSFYYYAGLGQGKPSSDNSLNFIFPPAVYFVPVGQEKLVIMKR